MSADSSVESIILIDKREIPEASPISLRRKRDNAAILDFTIPARTLAGLRDVEKHFRQGSLVELYLGIGTGAQRVFYGLLPSLLSDRNLRESGNELQLTAHDFIGQLESRTLELGDSTSSYLDPEGQEIGGLVASMVQTVINSQFDTSLVDFSIQGIEGTDPARIVSSEEAKRGVDTIKKHIDTYTALAYDDTTYPDAPLLYEYHQRDNYFVWRKEKETDTPPALRLVLGKDAILSGEIQRQPLYTDAYATGIGTARWTHSDRDSSRRWGGRRFWTRLSVDSSDVGDAYNSAVRTVELYKHERITFSLLCARDAYFLHPGDIIALENADAQGIPSADQRVSEVRIRYAPTIRTEITVGDVPRTLTDYL